MPSVRVTAILMLVFLAGCRDSQPSTTAASEAVASKHVSCSSHDPLTAIGRRLEGPVSMRMTWTRTGGEGDSLLVDEVFERDDSGLRRYAFLTRMPLEPLEDYAEVVLDESAVYVSFLESALPEAAGKWVKADISDVEYVENLVTTDPAIGNLFGYLDYFIGPDASLKAWADNGPSGLNMPREDYVVSEDTAWSKPGRCAYVVRSEQTSVAAHIILDDQGRVVHAEELGLIGSRQAYWLTVSYNPVRIVVPGAEEIVPDKVGREYVVGTWVTGLLNTAEYFVLQPEFSDGGQSTESYFKLLVEAGLESHAGLGWGEVTQTLRGADGKPLVVRDNGLIVADIKQLDPVLKQVELSYEGAAVCVRINPSSAVVAAGNCEW